MLGGSLVGSEVLVTGGSGLMGLPLALALAPTCRVIAAARYSDDLEIERLRVAGVEPVVFDLGDHDLSVLPRRVDVVFHLGAMTGPAVELPANKEVALEANVRATGRLLSRFRHCRAFVYASSGSTYAFQGGRPLREDDTYGLHNGLETYSATKIAAEQVVHVLSQEWNVPAVILRIFSLYGPRGGALSGRLDHVAKGIPIEIYPDGPNRYCPMFESDYVEKAIAAVGLASVPAEVVNFAGTEVSSVEEYCTVAGEMLGRRPTFERTARAPYPILPDTTKMERLLGPTSVSVADGIRRVLAAGTGARTARWGYERATT